jgi:predicted HTH domain antitoxin
MQITIEIPDELAQRLNGEWGSLSRRLLEVFVAEAYRSGALSTAEVRRTLQLPSRLETHAFLKRMGVYLNYDYEELERDIQTLEELRNP